MRDRFYSSAALILTAAAFLAGCSGGGGGSAPPVQSVPTQTPSASPLASTEAAVSDTNALGSPLADFDDFDKTIDSASGEAALSSRGRDASTGACTGGVEFFAPDRKGDADSTEAIAFYDAACTEEAQDIVRIFTPTGTSSETVAVTGSLYAIGNATAIATRTQTRTITNATFDTNGFPLVADGFDLTENSSLALSGSKAIASSREVAMEPASAGVSTYCSDAAGYNATGFPKLDETFGWQGGVLAGGTRTVNADKSVTWTGTHAGTTFKGAIGELSIAAGTQNTSCPIAKPMFSLAGGTITGTYSIPVTATFAYGRIESLTISNATLANGNTLDVTTNPTAGSSSSQFITGSVSSGTTQIATFAVDAFGDGTLTVTSSGAQFVIMDWHVVR